jgi:glucokinase
MSASCVIGVDLGGTKALAGAIDADLQVHHRARREMNGLDQAKVVSAVVDAVNEVREAAPIEIEAVGFGIPCLIDQRTGTAVMAVNLPITDFPLRDVMAERLGLPVFVDNDANVAALAEHRYGAARGTRFSVTLTLGTGIGGGMVLDGRLYHGFAGAGAELGHTVIDLNGPPCQGNCPNHGCLETMASGTALAREARAFAEANPDSNLGRALAAGRELNGLYVTEMAHDGDRDAVELIALIGRRLGVGLANFVNIFNPEVIVIGGGLIAAGELLLTPARQEMDRRALPFPRDLVRVAAAHFGSDAGLIGAAALAFDGLEDRQTVI